MEITRKELDLVLEALRSTKRVRLENLEQLRIVKDDIINESCIKEATCLQQNIEKVISDLHTLDRLIEGCEKDDIIHINRRT